jgi:hypothetical protein
MPHEYRMVAYRQPGNLVLYPQERQELLLIRTAIEPPEIKAGDPGVRSQKILATRSALTNLRNWTRLRLVHILLSLRILCTVNSSVSRLPVFAFSSARRHWNCSVNYTKCSKSRTLWTPKEGWYSFCEHIGSHDKSRLRIPVHSLLHTNAYHGR